MGGFGSIWHWVIVGVIVLVMFGGRGKISDLMGDFAKGIKAFKKGMSDDEDEKKPAPSVTANEPVRTLPHQSNEPASAASAQQPAPTSADRKVG